MGRNKNKVIKKDKMVYVFRGEGTLTPPGMTMSAAFEGWFLDWSIEHPYVLLLDKVVKAEKHHLPTPIIYKSKYTFDEEGSSLLKYRGGNWMKPIGYQNTDEPKYSMMFKFLESKYENFVFMSHKKDPEIRNIMSTHKNWKTFFIEEWKDTALYMKQLMWDGVDLG